MSCAQLKIHIAAKQADMEKTKAALKAHDEHMNYLISVFEQEIYELNVKLQLAEADESFVPYTAEEAAEEDGEINNFFASNPRAAEWGQRRAEQDDDDEPCYHCGRANYSCICAQAPAEAEVEAPHDIWRPVPVARKVRTKLKWVCELNPETYRVAVVTGDGILEVKRVTDGGGHCHDTTLCQCSPCSEIHLSNRLGAPMPPWLSRVPLLKTFFATEADWLNSLPTGGKRGSIQTTVPAISARTLKKSSCTPLTGATDGLKLKELEERFPGGTMLLQTSTGIFEVEHVYYDIASYPENWCHQIYSRKLEKSFMNFSDLGKSPRSNGKPQFMVEWKGLYIDLSHLF
jgi:hypothetical protein